MPKRFFKRFAKYHERIRNHAHFKILGDHHLNPNLWHFNRYSVATAFSIGLFCMMMPIPFQMVLAAALAILLRANLPISVVLVWISNPITMPPIFYCCYKIGVFVLRLTPQAIQSQSSLHWFGEQLGQIWQPLITGCFIMGILLALIGNLAIRVIWRVYISHKWRKRNAKRTNQV